MDGLATHDVPDAVAPEGWRLDVSGRVDRPLSLAAGDLRSMEGVRVEGDFSCVEGWTATDLTWRGVRVADVLDRARPEAAAEHAIVRAMDGDYACGFALDRLDGALLALDLDGEPLPVEHGGPARLVPGPTDSDCWESVKWVAGIELLADEPDEDDTARGIALSRADRD
ncbi:MAG: molybdopterin-dependent oxidoreductase [Haloferacaceae archaeon]